MRRAEAEGEPEAKRTPPAEAEADAGQRRRLRFAVICSSNQNRSMEAHLCLSKRGFNVRSYGTGTHVKLPGASADKPNVYEFGKATYEEMYAELEQTDRQLYTTNGILNMLDRNRAIKLRPERFQDEAEQFDVIVTCESRVYEQVLQALEDRGTVDNAPVHVCNLDIKDNHEAATIGAFDIVELCDQLESASDLEAEVEAIIEDFETKRKQTVLHAMAFY